jgi:hypothetical protein
MLLGRHDSKRAGQCTHRPLRGHAKLRADQRSVRYLKTSAGAGVQTASCWWSGVMKSANHFRSFSASADEVIDGALFR